MIKDHLGGMFSVIFGKRLSCISKLECSRATRSHCHSHGIDTLTISSIKDKQSWKFWFYSQMMSNRLILKRPRQFYQGTDFPLQGISIV